MTDYHSDQEGQIQFKPLSTGLGFHPFSDGLPYAPQSKNPQVARATGSGAVSAGPPTFQFPKPEAPAKAHAATAAKPVAPLSVVPAFGWSYLPRRVFAFAFDLLVQSSIIAIGASYYFWEQDIRPEVLLNPSVGFVVALFLALGNWALITLQETFIGTTLGKWLFGLTLGGTIGHRFLRAFFFLPSVGFLGLGVLWSVVDRRKRCWHDWVADLQPMDRPPLKLRRR